MLVTVDVPERDESYPVIVTKYKDVMHARLAAYYHIYGAHEIPSQDRIKCLTTVDKKVFYCDASIY